MVRDVNHGIRTSGDDNQVRWQGTCISSSPAMTYFAAVWWLQIMRGVARSKELKMAQNPLVNVLPAHVRQRIYLVYAIVAFVAGAVQVGIAAAGQGQPIWLTVVLSVLAFVGAPLGATAASNVQAPVPAPVTPQPQGSTT